MKFKLRFSKSAVRDIEEVLAYTLAQFGQQKTEQYKELIRQALAEIATDPNHPPAKYRPEIHADARTFHLARRGRRARHLFLYRVIGNEFVDIARLLHDSMEIERHLPEGLDLKDPQG